MRKQDIKGDTGYYLIFIVIKKLKKKHVGTMKVRCMCVCDVSTSNAVNPRDIFLSRHLCVS